MKKQNTLSVAPDGESLDSKAAPAPTPWKHPGGKLWKMGAQSLTEDELLAILIGTGTEGHSALQIAKEILDEYCSLYGIMGKDAEALLKIKGLKKVKLIRLMAAYELAHRLIRHNENWGDFKPLEKKKASSKLPSDLF